MTGKISMRLPLCDIEVHDVYKEKAGYLQKDT
jgi:hypothetical protein